MAYSSSSQDNVPIEALLGSPARRFFYPQYGYGASSPNVIALRSRGVSRGSNGISKWFYHNKQNLIQAAFAAFASVVAIVVLIYMCKATQSRVPGYLAIRRRLSDHERDSDSDALVICEDSGEEDDVSSPTTPRTTTEEDSPELRKKLAKLETGATETEAARPATPDSDKRRKRLAARDQQGASPGEKDDAVVNEIRERREPQPSTFRSPISQAMTDYGYAGGMVEQPSGSLSQQTEVTRAHGTPSHQTTSTDVGAPVATSPSDAPWGTATSSEELLAAEGLLSLKRSMPAASDNQQGSLQQQQHIIVSPLGRFLQPIPILVQVAPSLLQIQVVNVINAPGSSVSGPQLQPSFSLATPGIHAPQQSPQQPLVVLPHQQQGSDRPPEPAGEISQDAALPTLPATAGSSAPTVVSHPDDHPSGASGSPDPDQPSTSATAVAQQPTENLEHPFFRLPVVPPGSYRDLLDVQHAVAVPRLLPSPMLVCSRLRSLLAQRSLGLPELREVAYLTELLISHLMDRPAGGSPGEHAGVAVRRLGMRYIMLEMVVSALQILGEPPCGSWWQTLTARIPEAYSRQLGSAASRAQVKYLHDLAARLSNALALLKTGVRPSRDETVALKRLLLCSRRGHTHFERAQWDPWREADREA